MYVSLFVAGHMHARSKVLLHTYLNLNHNYAKQRAVPPEDRPGRSRGRRQTENEFEQGL